MARAQGGWPSRPIRFVVPFPAGGTTDILARIVAKPDGRTLLMTTIGTAAINDGLYRDLPYGPDDLAAVSNVAIVPNVIIAAPSLPAATLQEVVELAKRSRGLTIGSSGDGTSLHLTGELLKQAAGIERPSRGWRRGTGRAGPRTANRSPCVCRTAVMVLVENDWERWMRGRASAYAELGSRDCGRRAYH